MSELPDYILDLLRRDDPPTRVTLEATRMGLEDDPRVRCTHGDREFILPGRVATLDGRSGVPPWYVSTQSYLAPQGLRVAVLLALGGRATTSRPTTTIQWYASDGTAIKYLAPSVHAWFQADGKVEPPPEGAVLRVTFAFGLDQTSPTP